MPVLKFRSSLFKGLRFPKAEPWSLSAESETPLYGAFFLLSFFFCACYGQKKKRRSYSADIIYVCETAGANPRPTPFLKFGSSLFKGLRFPKAEPWSPPAGGETPLYGAFFLQSFFFAPVVPKKKRRRLSGNITMRREQAPALRFFEV